MTAIGRRLMGAIASAAMVFAGAAVQAQTPAPAPASYIDAARGLTIDDVVSLALGRSARVAAARERINVARGARAQADLRANPEVGVTQREQLGGSDRQTAFDVRLPLELFRRPARQAAADRVTDLADAEARAVEWELAAGVRRAAGRVLAAILVLDLTEQQARAVRELRDLAATSAERGAVPRLDRDLAEVEVRRLEAAVQQRRGDVDAALATLKGAAGVDPDATLLPRRALDVEAAAAVATTTRLLDAEAAARSLDARPDVRTIGAQAAVAAADQAALRQNGRWDLALMAGYARTDMSFPQSGLNAGGGPAPIAGRFHELSFGASIALPLFNRNQGAIAAASASERAATRDREAATLEARAELRAATARWSGAQRAAAVYAGGLLQLARQNVDVTQQTWQAGRGTLNDVIAERRRQLDLDMNYAALLLELYDADVDVRRALGVIR